MMPMKMLMETVINDYHHDPDKCSIKKTEEGKCYLSTVWGDIFHDTETDKVFVFVPNNDQTPDIASLANLSSFLFWFTRYGRVASSAGAQMEDWEPVAETDSEEPELKLISNG